MAPGSFHIIGVPLAGGAWDEPAPFFFLHCADARDVYGTAEPMRSATIASSAKRCLAVDKIRNIVRNLRASDTMEMVIMVLTTESPCRDRAQKSAFRIMLGKPGSAQVGMYRTEPRPEGSGAAS